MENEKHSKVQTKFEQALSKISAWQKALERKLQSERLTTPKKI